MGRDIMKPTKHGTGARVTEKKDHGIPCCVNCIGMHPNETITMMEVIQRIRHPAKVVYKKLMQFERLKDQYKDKSCMLCGRTYTKNGDLDETWELSAKRVKLEFEALGIHGVSDGDIKQVVASCIKSWKMLWKNRATIKPEDAEKMTFCGRLALILTHAEEARSKRNTLGGGKKGIIV